ncbi:helix-turn-helix domain-containing protein [Bradyrhizobium sp. LTSP857]|uniref:helix-turn-helix domain-containing protein n=1 Tax=Bradyrhizobium sp. LTSP857 TaxID=1619231 RepID=UPI0012E09378|nr:helix-turn-helix domain-containing protein [Bradyrhizobium sp. LTSP857]
MSLPISRRDIAEYLGRTLETLSRAVSRLQREGVVTFGGNTQREIVILDRQAPELRSAERGHCSQRHMAPTAQ